MIDPQLTAILARALMGGARPHVAGPHGPLARMPTAQYPQAPHLLPARPKTPLDHYSDKVARDAVASWHSFSAYPPGHPSME